MGCYGDANARTPHLDTLARQGGPFRRSHLEHARLLPVPRLPDVRPVRSSQRRDQQRRAGSGRRSSASPRRFATRATRPATPASGTSLRRAEAKGVRPTDFRLQAASSASTAPTGTPPTSPTWHSSSSPKRARDRLPGCCSFPGSCRTRLTRRPTDTASISRTSRFPPNVPAGAATENAQACLPDYYGMIESIDDEFARILAALEKAGVANDTIVVFSSDHGDMIGSQGLNRQALALRRIGPHPVPDPVSPCHQARHGHCRSLRLTRRLPYARRIGRCEVARRSRRRRFLAPAPRRDHEAAARLCLSGNAVRLRSLAWLEGNSHAQYMYARTKDKPWLLFDLAKTPWEMKNLIDDPASQSLVKEMDARLERRHASDGDSLGHRATRR